MNSISELSFTNFMLDLSEQLPDKAKEFDRLLNVINLINDTYSKLLKFVYLSSYKAISKPFSEVDGLAVRFIVDDELLAEYKEDLKYDLDYYFNSELKKYNLKYDILNSNINVFGEFLVWQSSFSKLDMQCTGEMFEAYSKLKDTYPNSYIFSDLRNTVLLKCNPTDAAGVYKKMIALGFEYTLEATKSYKPKFIIIPTDSKWLKFDLPLFELLEVNFVDAENNEIFS